MTYTPSPPPAPDALHPKRAAAGRDDLSSTKAVTAVTPVTRILEMTVSQFEAAGAALELRVGWTDTTLWLVPRGCHVELLVRQGIARGRIWTVRELADFLAAPGLTRDDIEKMVHLKTAFGAVIIDVVPDTGDAEQPGNA